MDKRQERCIEILDGLVDQGINIERLSDELPKREYDALRKRAVRAFGSYQNALLAFGISDEALTPLEFEVGKCFYINEYYEIQVNEAEKEHLRGIFNISETEFSAISKSVWSELRKDAIDEFFRNEFPDNLKYSFIEREEYKHIRSYIFSVYGGFNAFLEAYGTPGHVFVDYDYDRWNGESIKNGHVFEALVREVMEALYINVQYHTLINGCRPDFIVENRWIDAKLSYHTVIHPRNTTIERYTQQTKDLTIVYAKCPRNPFEYRGVKFLHVSNFYTELLGAGKSELVERIKSFVEIVNESEAA